MSGCSLVDVSARWRSAAVLKNVELNLPVFDLGAIPLMGPSGHGKSTLLYLLAALKWPTTGSIHWKLPSGVDIRCNRAGMQTGSAESFRRNRIGFAFQDSTLSQHMTLAENLRYPLMDRISPAATEDRIQTEIRKTFTDLESKDIDALLRKFPHELSGGQRQRAALIQAMIRDPQLLFADEPAGNLDLQTRTKVMGVLRRWLSEREGERALIWVTHHLDDADLMGCEQIIWIENRSVRIVDKEWITRWSKP